ncbi:MAG: Ig domain-containing protein [Nitrospira sp.]
MHNRSFLSRLGARGERSRALKCADSLRWSGIALVALLAGCDLESNQSGVTPGSGVFQSGNRPPVIRQAVVFPTPLILSGPIAVQIEADDAGRNPLTFHYQWFVNGHRVDGETHPTLSPALLKLGDKVEVEIVASDGQISWKPYRTGPAIVGNTLPEVVKVSIEPTGSDRSNMHALVEGVDVDRDAIHYTYRWWRNGTLVAGEDTAALDTGTFSRGDSITVEVIPRDAGGVGKSRLSEPVALGNNAPKITSHPPSKFDKGVFVYSVQAIDDDKDSLKYLLEAAPSGMTIDPATGMISWQVASDAKGTHRVRILVQDGHGGSAFQDFDLSPGAPPNVKG